MEENNKCELCQREEVNLTKHHLIPRTRHKNKRNKRLFTRKEVVERVIWICSPCHKNIHANLTEKELEEEYNTLEKLLAHPGIKKFTDWISDKPGLVSLRVRKAKK